MAFSQNKIYKQSLKIIEEKGVLDIKELITLLPCNKSTFYELFPAESEKMESLKELINDNKIVQCGSLKRKWLKSENATLQIAVYKLMGDDDEVHRLNASRTESTLKGDPEHPIQINDEAKRDKLIAELTAKLNSTTGKPKE